MSKKRKLNPKKSTGRASSTKVVPSQDLVDLFVREATERQKDLLPNCRSNSIGLRAVRSNLSYRTDFMHVDDGAIRRSGRCNCAVWARSSN